MKNKYAIGVCALEEDIEVIIVEADNGLSAMRQVVLDKFNWDCLENGRLPYITADEAITFFLQGDINISKPVQIS